MTPGAILAHGHDLYVVLAQKEAMLVLAPLVLEHRARVANAVPVRAGSLGDGYVLCAAARIQEKSNFRFGNAFLNLRDLEACQQAAQRAQADKMLTQRYAPLSAFEQAMPRIDRHVGRRVAPRFSV